MSNGYPKKFLQQVEQKRVMFKNRTPPPEELVRLFFELVEPKTNRSYAVLPYIKGLTEPLRRILKPHTKILKTGTPEMPFPANWALIFSAKIAIDDDLIINLKNITGHQ